MGTAMRSREDSQEHIIVRHTARIGAVAYTFCLVAPAALGRRAIGAALADAVAELRAIDSTFNPTRRDSLASENGPVTGWAIERAAARLRAAGVTGYAVSGGTHLAVRGRAPGGGSWV
jgi:thiamine biosynthesis lipoprotein